MEDENGSGGLLFVVAGVLVAAVAVIISPLLVVTALFSGGQSAAACPPASSASAAPGSGDATPPPAGEKGEDGRPAPFYGSVDGESSVTGGLIPAEWEQDVVNASKTSGIPTSWIAAQLESESRWNAGLGHNHAGAAGLAQFTDATWATYGHGASQSDPKASIRAMGEYLRDLRQQIKPIADSSGQNEFDLTMAAYNAGPGAVQQYGGVPPYSETQGYLKRIHTLQKSFYERVYGNQVGGKSDGSVDTAPVENAAPQNGGSNNASAECNKPGGYSGGETSGNDDYPWKGYEQAPNPITGAYYVNCTDFSLWRLNQQVGATDPQKPKYTNSNFVDGMVLGDGGDWAGTWKAKGWPVDHTPEIGAMAHFDPGAAGASAQYGHIAVVKEVKDDGKTVVIEEYNAINPGAYSTREMPASSVSNYLHIPDSEKKK